MNIDLTTITSTDLTQISKLLKRKESLLAEVAAIDGNLRAFQTAKGPKIGLLRGRPRVTEPTARRNGERRGALKAKIIRHVKTAGQNGVAVKDLAAKLGMKYGNVATWFQSTGKKVKEIKKVGPAKYAWKA
ncbi:MAG: hypothetical protein HY735_31225 [Verrucomicrobia bacterium]|nr:hypothetical protein [Verrucomicrobiota bacterium]